MHSRICTLKQAAEVSWADGAALTRCPHRSQYLRCVTGAGEEYGEELGEEDIGDIDDDWGLDGAEADDEATA